MRATLYSNVNKLKGWLPELEQNRTRDGFANDLFEAADDLRHLAEHALSNDARVNYPVRARQELGLWKALGDRVQGRPTEEQERYASLFVTAQQIVQDLLAVEPPKDGYLGVLRIIRQKFGFVQTEYNFKIVKEEPIGARFSTGKVYLELEWAKNYSSSCVFGPEGKPQTSFWIDDLLFMHGDERYRTLPRDLALKTEKDVDEWFTFLAEVFKQYGRDVLTNQPGIFERLAKAQLQRDLGYTEEMDRRSKH